MAPGLKNVLERFEKTIQENEKAGCTSGSYLTQVAGKKNIVTRGKGGNSSGKNDSSTNCMNEIPPWKLKGIAGRPPPFPDHQQQLGQPNSQRSAPASFLEDSDFSLSLNSVNTQTTAASSTFNDSDDPFFIGTTATKGISVTSRHNAKHVNNDGFGDEFSDGFGENDFSEGSFGDFSFTEDDFGDEAFPIKQHEIEHTATEHDDFSGFATSGQQRKLNLPSKWSRQPSARKLVIEDDDGFSVVDDGASVVSSTSQTVKKSPKDTPSGSSSRRRRETSPRRRVRHYADEQQQSKESPKTRAQAHVSAGSVRRVRQSIQDNQEHPSDLVKLCTRSRKSSSTGGSDDSSVVSSSANPRPRRSTADSRRERRHERMSSSSSTGDKPSYSSGTSRRSTRAASLPACTES